MNYKLIKLRKIFFDKLEKTTYGRNEIKDIFSTSIIEFYETIEE